MFNLKIIIILISNGNRNSPPALFLPVGALVRVYYPYLDMIYIFENRVFFFFCVFIIILIYQYQLWNFKIDFVAISATIICN